MARVAQSTHALLAEPERSVQARTLNHLLNAEERDTKCTDIMGPVTLAPQTLTAWLQAQTVPMVQLTRLAQWSVRANARFQLWRVLTTRVLRQGADSQVQLPTWEQGQKLCFLLPLEEVLLAGNHVAERQLLDWVTITQESMSRRAAHLRTEAVPLPSSSSLQKYASVVTLLWDLWTVTQLSQTTTDGHGTQLWRCAQQTSLADLPAVLSAQLLEQFLYQQWGERRYECYIRRVRQLLLWLGENATFLRTQSPLAISSMDGHLLSTHTQSWRIREADLQEERERMQRVAREGDGTTEQRPEHPNGLHRCPRCGGQWTDQYAQLQLRSADEPMTCFVYCKDCCLHFKR